ncbi:choline dehydrogenase [Kitasatospora cystarginea]|uniref:Choline dehydrogenase n=1 Tax=Kitasatospora cystarginea TaxID=58350 RepID=A0ABN3EQT1_9ACTN
MSAERSVDNFDYIVVGAGSSGCAVASRLSADPSCSVLLVEAGDWHTRPEINRVDVPSLTALWTEPWGRGIDWGYTTEQEPHLEGRSIPIARGKGVGGCSSVNALMWVRGNRLDYERWSALGNTGWSFEEVLPYFIRAESYPTGAQDRGSSGPISVQDHRDPTPVAEAFVAAAEHLGYAAPEADYNGPRQDGFGFLYQTNRTAEGERCCCATGYLRPAADRPNLAIRTGAHATRIVLRDGRAAGLEHLHEGRLRTATAEGEIVLSAGAFETPKLLMLSGIGPAADLERQGIRCVQNLPGVGGNLQDHVFVPVCYQSLQTHPSAELISEAGLFTRSRLTPADAPPDLQFTFGTVKFLPASAPARAGEGHGFTFAPILLTPRSRGRVSLRSADPHEPAVVRAGYLGEQADVDVLVEGVELARELAHTPVFDAFRGEELAPGPAFGTGKELRGYVAAEATTLWHPVGTCRMGTGSDAVVDPQLRVRGVPGLRIADASIMPVIVSGNTNAPTVMIGEKAADLIRTTDS